MWSQVRQRRRCTHRPPTARQSPHAARKLLGTGVRGAASRWAQLVTGRNPFLALNLVCAHHQPDTSSGASPTGLGQGPAKRDRRRRRSPAAVSRATISREDTGWAPSARATP